MKYESEKGVELRVIRRKHHITMNGVDTVQDLVELLHARELNLAGLTLDQIEGPVDDVDLYRLILHEEHTEIIGARI